MKNRRMRTRMYGGVRGRKTKKVGRNSKIFVFLLLDCYALFLLYAAKSVTLAFVAFESRYG